MCYQKPQKLDGKGVMFLRCWKKGIVNPKSCTKENIFQEGRENQDILRWRKTGFVFGSVDRGNFINKKETIREGTLEYLCVVKS